MSKKTRRGLTPDDLEVWRQVAKTVERVETTFIEALREEKPLDKAQQPEPLSSFEISAPRREPQISISLAPHPQEVLTKAPPQMDRKNFDRLRKGKMTPDRRVDLHGMTADIAHAVLTQFILGAYAGGARLVLVITGKGRLHGPADTVMPQRRGIIRHSVPEWLRQAPVRDKIVQVIPAHRKHGGDGAYYVYLKRKR